MNHLCPENKAAARMTLSFDGNGWDLGGTIQNVVQNNVCVSRVEWDRASTSLDCNDAECRLKEAYKFQGINIKKQQTTTRTGNTDTLFDVEFGRMAPLDSVPTTLRTRQFPSDNLDPKPVRYDRTTRDSGLCGGRQAEPGVLHCVQSKSGGDWIGYKWFRFVDQPGLQQLNLPEEEKNYMQARITRLHAALNAKAPLNHWLKPPVGVPPLVEIDEALLVQPPNHFREGYVPVVVYQAMTKPPGGGCNQDVVDCVDAPTGFYIKTRTYNCDWAKSRVSRCYMPIYDGSTGIATGQQVRDVCPKTCNKCYIR
eukprot:CAMPEP_0118717354 /NCGR_PEP_ID=MMETSP0800-20121206/28093_1 /TAXON_ID=210618 ORGANISM="Striatella unipunctata, Strain CCMP2910" /NCGR_SAMPLE_ID=MMETSP0800 /ASSEMBLY_ACC=CAM_ASM_000638 /LENGTH=309 /DNA_ID=CAMNT_0006624043 /DNA_START=101 /DNA_END=1030 /DNA_ORIENTATION=-